MDNQTLTKQSYNNFASQYASLWGNQWEKDNAKYISKFFSLVKPHGKILDAGCGTGNVLKFVEKQGFEGYGIDMSIGMLNEAKKQINPTRLQNMDIYHLSFPDGMFDGVLSLYVLQHIEDIKRALIELKRVVPINSPLYLSIHVSSKKNSWKSFYAFPDNGGKVYMHYRSVDQILKLIEQVNLEIIDKSITNNTKQAQNLHLLLKKNTE